MAKRTVTDERTQAKIDRKQADKRKSNNRRALVELKRRTQEYREEDV